MESAGTVLVMRPWKHAWLLHHRSKTVDVRHETDAQPCLFADTLLATHGHVSPQTSGSTCGRHVGSCRVPGGNEWLRPSIRASGGLDSRAAGIARQRGEEEKPGLTGSGATGIAI